jgi:lipopolysaccharide transport system permease protein
MVRRDLKVRYKNSLLGFFWSLINPMLTCFVIWFLFSVINQDDTKNLSAYILAAYLPYMFFSMSILDATSSVLNQVNVIKKIYFPREILPLTAIISNFIHFLLSMVVFFLYLLVIYILHPGESPFRWTSLFLPILLVISLLMATGFGLLFSALNTFYEDVKYIVGFTMSMLFFLSPIMYFMEKVYYGHSRVQYYLYNFLNPVAPLSNGYRKILLAPQDVASGGAEKWPALPIAWRMIAFSGCASVVILLVGYHVFNRMKWRFVERP